MCIHGGEGDGGWQPVSFERGARRVRILCGAVDRTSPFIEGGCATDWVEDLSGADGALDCPRCGQRCPEDAVAGARGMLATRTVFVIGCPHRAFTFSRRECEPYFSVEDPRTNY
jgi:hypothetical protein